MLIIVYVVRTNSIVEIVKKLFYLVLICQNFFTLPALAMRTSFLFISFLNRITASNTVIRMQRGTYRFPIQFTDAGGDATVEGSGFLLPNEMHILLQRRPRDRIDGDSIQMQPRGILIGEYALTLDLASIPDVRSGSVAAIGVGRSSQFARRVPSFLLTPISDTEDALVLNPSNPVEYAHENRIFYTRSPAVNPLNPWSMRVLVRFAGNNSVTEAPTDADFIPCGFSTTGIERMLLPRRLRADFISLLSSIGISFSEEEAGNSLRLHDIDSVRLGTLPSVDIVIQNEDDDSQVHIGLLEPSHYLSRSQDAYEINFQRPFTAIGFMIPLSVVKDIVIHFDYENNRIGFADPIVEIV